MKKSTNLKKSNHIIYFEKVKKESYQYTDYKKYSSSKDVSIESPNYIKVNGGYNGNGGGYMNYVTQDQFNEYKEHITTRFNNVDKMLDKIDNDTSSTKNILKWVLGIVFTAGVTMVIGFITIIINLL